VLLDVFTVVTVKYAFLACDVVWIGVFLRKVGRPAEALNCTASHPRRL